MIVQCPCTRAGSCWRDTNQDRAERQAEGPTQLPPPPCRATWVPFREGDVRHAADGMGKAAGPPRSPHHSGWLAVAWGRCGCGVRGRGRGGRRARPRRGVHMKCGPDRPAAEESRRLRLAILLLRCIPPSSAPPWTAAVQVQQLYRQQRQWPSHFLLVCLLGRPLPIDLPSSILSVLHLRLHPSIMPCQSAICKAAIHANASLSCTAQHTLSDD
jgi:hypothetical protein